MGYNLYITRKENWIDEDDSNSISVTEWTEYVKSDSEMRLDNFAEATTKNGEYVRVETEGVSVWTKYSKDGLDGNHAWFSPTNGNIVVKNPDIEIRNKMIDIAGQLKAKVQGDDGEFYHTKETLAEKRPWWKI
jgi:predicted extracellular nuclease